MNEFRPGATSRRQPDRIVEAGVALTLPHVTITSVATYLGVSQVTMYRHVASASDLRHAVAEGILARQKLPSPRGAGLEGELLALAFSIRDFIHEYPGIGAFLAGEDRTGLTTNAMLASECVAYANAYRLESGSATWAVTVVAEHAMSLSELIHRPAPGTDFDAGVHVERALRLRDLSQIALFEADYHFGWSMRAVVVGIVALLRDRGSLPSH